MEQSAESAALPVAAAAVFGAGIWAVLGHAKAEGENIEKIGVYRYNNYKIIL